MARGWESKAVADQIEEGNSRRDRGFKGSVSPESREQQERLRSLLLSRSRVLQQLDRASHPGHRDTLLKGLKAIEKEIDEVSAKVPESSQ